MTSTYVNDLRLNEMATGDASGSWGTNTNANLTLIGEALGFGTEAITTNADTHTSTIADGASDPIRAIFIKYTGTLDSTCTITIGPNTVNKFCFIHNATSGSQSIIISQGSGANVTIATGQTKGVYLDGAASGAAVIDAFATLSVVDLLVDDDLTVAGLATIGETLAVTGVVTANAGVVVDNFTLDGTTLALSTGSMKLEAVGGDILLDASTGDIKFQDDGVEIGKIRSTNSNLNIFSSVNDKDIVFSGVDNSGGIVALTLDMSDAGTAIFNHDISLGDNQFIFLGAGQDLTLRGDGTNGLITSPNGNLAFDVGTYIVLDADQDGNIYLNDGGVGYGQLSGASGNFTMKCPTSDKDIIFTGNDGGSAITALTLDMSDAGTAFFNNAISMPNYIYHTGDGGTDTYFGFPSDNTVKFVTGNVESFVVSLSDVVVNDGGNDINFRVESDTNTHALFVDAGSHQVAIGTSDLNTDSDPALLTIQSRASSNHAIHISSTSADGSNGGGFFTSSQKDDKSTGWTTLGFWDDGSDRRMYYGGGGWGGEEATNHVFYAGNYDAGLGGALERFRINTTECVFNDASLNNDFRVEGSTNTHMLFVDAGNDSISIGTSTSTSDTHLRIAGSASKYSVKYNNAYGGGTAIYANNTNNQGWIYARFNTNASLVGYISVGTSSTSYITSSDYRLKENVDYTWDATTRLKQLKPARFNFVVDSDTTVDGFLAHEVSSVVPEAITGEKDAVDADGVAVMQGIDQSKLVPLLVKTIQELEARITALENA